VRLRVASIEEYDYARVLALTLEGEGLTARLELPRKLLDEIGWRPSQGEEVEVALEGERGSLEDWEIVMSGRVLRASEGEVAYTFGGLLLVVRGAGVRPLSKAYLKLRRTAR